MSVSVVFALYNSSVARMSRCMCPLALPNRVPNLKIRTRTCTFMFCIVPISRLNTFLIRVPSAEDSIIADTNDYANLDLSDEQQPQLEQRRGVFGVFMGGRQLFGDGGLFNRLLGRQTTNVCLFGTLLC